MASTMIDSSRSTQATSYNEQKRVRLDRTNISGHSDIKPDQWESNKGNPHIIVRTCSSSETLSGEVPYNAKATLQYILYEKLNQKLD